MRVYSQHNYQQLHFLMHGIIHQLLRQQQAVAVVVNTSYYINRQVRDNRSKQAAALTLYTAILSSAD